MSNPNDYFYTKEHEWVEDNGDVVTIGVTDFAQESLGDIVYVELPEVGSDFEEGDAMGSIESVKAVSEFFAPVKGKVIEVNKELEYAPDVINDSPYDSGWIVKLKIDPLDLPSDFMDESAYLAFTEE